MDEPLHPIQEAVDDASFVDALMDIPADPAPPPLRRITRVRKPNPRYAQHGAVVVRSYCAAMISAVMLTRGEAYDNRYLLNLLLDQDFGLYKNLDADTPMRHPQAMKASSTHDPDSPRLHEAMKGEHHEDFLMAMGKEIQELEAHGTWMVVKKESLHHGANLPPSTWAFKIKRFPMAACKSTRHGSAAKATSRLKGLTIF
jgi:hypothetical protein